MKDRPCHKKIGTGGQNGKEYREQNKKLQTPERKTQNCNKGLYGIGIFEGPDPGRKKRKKESIPL